MGNKIEIVGSGATEKLAKLMKKAEQGKASLEEICQTLDSVPEVEKQIGNISQQAQWSWIRTYSGGNELVGEATRRKMLSQIKDIAGLDASPLEKSLATRVVLCQFQLDYIDSLLAAKTREGMNSGQVTMYQQWLDKAQSRYLNAVKTLALVRKLARPVVQLNVGEKQVNIASLEVGMESSRQLHQKNSKNNG